MREEKIREGRMRADLGLGVVAVFGFFFLVIFLVLFFHRFKFDGIQRRHFEVAAALSASNDLAFIDLVVFNIKAGLALWTVQHSPSDRCLGFMIARLYIYCLPGSQVKCQAHRSACVTD